MSEDSTEKVEASGSLDDPVESTIDCFETEWRDGKTPNIGEFLSMPTALSAVAAQQLLVELVLVDLEYRWRAREDAIPPSDPLGLRPCLTAYVRAFPVLGPVDRLPAEVLGEEYRVRQLWGDRPTVDRFLAEYPAQFGALVKLLSRVDAGLLADGAKSQPASHPLSPPPPDPRAPLPFEDYELKQHLGTGGMGKVYRATQRSLQRDVAVKALLKSRQHEPTAVEQFLQEAQIVGRLNHPNIVGVHGLGRFPGGGYFLVMDLIDGQDLAERLEHGVFSIAEAVRVACQIADAIQHAHDQGVVHCDLKPGNVLLDDAGRAFVTDFGLARLVRHTSGDSEEQSGIGGTLGYMAPEQFEPIGVAITPAVDVYGIGAVLYALLTGRAPRESDARGIAGTDQWQSAKIKPISESRPDVSEALEDLCDKCLATTPSRRYASARELANALNDLFPLKPHVDTQ